MSKKEDGCGRTNAGVSSFHGLKLPAESVFRIEDVVRFNTQGTAQRFEQNIDSQKKNTETGPFSLLGPSRDGQAAQCCQQSGRSVECKVIECSGKD
jgi:hypothetical protein